MILSHKHKFIFIKTNKTAGTSVEIALSRFCGPDDIITPISEVDEKMRLDLGYRGAQNYGKREDGKPLFYNHMSAKEIRELVGREVWKEYYKFTIERNPWDRVISLFYRTDLKKSSSMTLTEFVHSGMIKHLKRRGIELYSAEGKIVVNKILKFENLDTEVVELGKKLCLPGALDLPHTKANTRKDKRHYREVLSKSDRVAIAKMFSDEISLMNYKF